MFMVEASFFVSITVYTVYIAASTTFLVHSGHTSSSICVYVCVYTDMCVYVYVDVNIRLAISAGFSSRDAFR